MSHRRGPLEDLRVASVHLGEWEAREGGKEVMQQMAVTCSDVDSSTGRVRNGHRVRRSLPHLASGVGPAATPHNRWAASLLWTIDGPGDPSPTGAMAGEA